MLAPDSAYLKGFDAIAMQASVDFFGFMSYDLHGAWDADNKDIGSIVRGQADIRDIMNDTYPLWFQGLDPGKLNFGIAYYGRGYTLASTYCTALGCPFIGPSSPAPCTNAPGVMSLAEIMTTIEEKNIVPVLLTDSMMKQITWQDQWIAYDDHETIAMKKAWADSHCFGGTMIWSVDFASKLDTYGFSCLLSRRSLIADLYYSGTICLQDLQPQAQTEGVVLLPAV